PRTGDATTCRFVITNLLAQRDSTINLVTQADPGLCVVPAFAESIFVGAKHLTGACSRTSPSDPLGLRPLVESLTVTAGTKAAVLCAKPPCDVSGDSLVCVGNQKPYTTTVPDTFIRRWSVTTVPPKICQFVGTALGGAVQVLFTAKGSCDVTLTVIDAA